MLFVASDDIAPMCKCYGEILLAAELPDPSKCYVTSECAEVAAVGEKCTATLQAINSKGEPCEKYVRSPTCELVSELTATRADCRVERIGQSQYEISYQSSIKGRHQLHIKVEEQHVRGSPLSVAVKSPVERLGVPILTVGGVKQPWGVVINQKGEMVVTEYNGHCVSVFSPSGEKRLPFGLCGTGHGRFDNPQGLTIDGDG